MPPWRQIGERTEPTRARPVPFCFHNFLPEPETSFLILGGGGTLAHCSAIVFHRFPEQCLVYLARREHFIRQLERANRLSTEIDYINSLPSFSLSSRTAHTAFALRAQASNAFPARLRPIRAHSARNG